MKIASFIDGARIAERGRMSILHFACWAILGSAGLLVGACGGSDDGGGGNGSGGTSSGGAGVNCAGTTVCASGQSCCVPVSGEAVCEATCSTGKPFACDGPEDCQGKPCCGSVTQGFSCASGDACDPGVAQRCHVTADCPSGKSCLPANMTPTGSTQAVPLDSCAQI